MFGAVIARARRSACPLALIAGALAGPVVSGGATAHAQPAPVTRADHRLAEAARALSAGDRARAAELGSAYLKAHPDDPKGHVLMARAHLAGGDFDAAYVELTRALAANPREIDALYYLGLVSARLSEAQFKRLATMAPDSPRLHQLLAESLEAQGERHAAAREYQAALDRDPRLVPALLGLAKLKRVQLECEDAIALYEKAEALQPTFDGAYGLGMCQSVLQEDGEAVEHFRQALKFDPKSPVAWVGLGTSLNKLGHATEAIAALQKAIAIEPGMGEAYYALGLAYRRNHQPDQAADAFRKAERLGGAIGGGAPAPETPR